MPRKPKNVTETTLSEGQLTRAALNKPVKTFKLGDRTFAIKDLPYDDLLEFSDYLSPFLDGMASRFVSSRMGISVPEIPALGEAVTVSKILQMCGKQLPEMTQIICRQTDPAITVAEIKRLVKFPSELLAPIMDQISQSQLAQEIGNFFALMTTMFSKKT